MGTGNPNKLGSDIPSLGKLKRSRSEKSEKGDSVKPHLEENIERFSNILQSICGS